MLYFLAEQHAKWSRETFGLDRDRGPLGALRHLAKEVQEVIAAPDDVEEYADCLLLLLDASRRAGISATQLVQAGLAKLEKNKARKWPAVIPGVPCEHVEEAQ